MVGFIIKFLFTALGLFVSWQFFHLIGFDDTAALLLAALVLGVVNAIIRPILLVLTFPITVVTLGLFLFVLNGLMVSLMGWLLKDHGVHVSGFWDPIFTAIVLGITSWIAHLIVGEGKRAEKR